MLVIDERRLQHFDVFLVIYVTLDNMLFGQSMDAHAAHTTGLHLGKQGIWG